MGKSAPQESYVAAIIERVDNAILIALPPGQGLQERRWRFPLARKKRAEMPEVAIRRLAKTVLGTELEIVVGQPPIPVLIDGVPSILRYFFCGLLGDEPTPGPYDEVRWVQRGRLIEYEYDETAHAVVDWLVEQHE